MRTEQKNLHLPSDPNSSISTEHSQMEDSLSTEFFLKKILPSLCLYFEMYKLIKIITI